uniref:Proteasome-associated protein ECM29 n=1 Tax=Anthurium amnicola TaxID=1678845 RepID=A0A1D1XKS2_9ARAE
MAEPSSASSASSPPALPSDAEREEMLDRMLTRLALADDSKLEALLSRILPYSISAMASPSPSVRKLVMEILSHVNKRVRHQLEIRLPLPELWKMYGEDGAIPIVRNFCIVYIEMAFDRLSLEEKSNLAPEFLSNIGKLPLQHQDIILRIVSKVIGECHSSQIDTMIGNKYKVIVNDGAGQVFLDFCLHTLLYQPPPPGVGCPPGLSAAQSDRVTGKLPLKGDTLLMRKLGILNIIDAVDVAPSLVYPLCLAACSDSQESVVKRGEELVKRKAARVNLEDPGLVNILFLLFNGSIGVENIPAEKRISPGNPALRTRLMSIFCRSVAAANAFPSTLQCIFGCIYGSGTTSRLKQLGMEFTVWVFKHAEIDQLKFMGPVILSGILKTLDGYSNNKPVISGDVKSFAFQAIGLLAHRMPQLFRDKIDVALRLFNALKLEDQSLRLTIQEATNSLAVAYKGAPSAVLKDLEAFLLENCIVDQGEVRFCAVRWATTLFDMRHCPSRFICILAAADSKLDIREMALEGLSLKKDQGENGSIDYPDLRDMLDYICKQQPRLLDSTEMREEKLLFPSRMYIAMVNFMMKCFWADFGQDDSKKTYQASPSIIRFCLLLEHAMAFEASVELHATACKALVSIGSRFPELLASHYGKRISWLKQLLGHIDADTRESASRLLGIACSAISTDVMSTLIGELLSSIDSTMRYENRQGALCAIGYVMAECVKENPVILETLLESTVSCLVGIVESESLALASVAMEALGHIGLRCPVPPIATNSSTAGVLEILGKRLSKLLTGDDIKATQKIVISLGHISMKDASFSNLKVALDLIFSLCRTKVEDVLFATGEALSFMWGGVPVTADTILKSNYSSLSQSSNYLTSEMPLSTSGYSYFESVCNDDSRNLLREEITRKLFDGLLYSSRKEERCAGTVWLLSLTMYCGRHSKIQQLLPEIQEAFSHLLGEQNELTQELASQGMSIVYELGDSSMRKDLVNALVNTLTGSGKRKRAVKLVEDSEVFQEGAIGEGPGGGKLNTYKELCSLANEMGQPDLIYKFLDLANYQSSLNSKRGAAFGFSRIAKQAGDALQPHLHSLIPRLVRYQYDPDKNVQDAMGHIWKSIVSDPKKTIEEQFDPIVEDLLLHSGSRLWRSREASCLALADIIQGRNFDQVAKHLKQLWTAAFRAMDDIKETVRNSGHSLHRAVSSLTVRLCDVSLTAVSDTSRTMDIVLPFFLVEGIVSKVESVRKASVGMVMKLSKGAGVALRPHLPELVCCMLESLSSLEDQRLNYVELHASSAGIHAEKLETMRISVARDSPMWETLNLCLNVVDTKSLDMLVPRLAQLVRAGVGLNTRVGVANFISLLGQKVNADIKPFTSMLLKPLLRAVMEEKTNAAKQAFATACATTLKYAGASNAQKIIEETVALHLGDRNAHISCAILLKNYLNIAADIVSGYHATVLPVVFVARFEDDKDVSDQFEALWEETVGSESITLQLYLAEIVPLLCNCITSSSWASKRKSAKAIRKLSEILGESLSPFHHGLLKILLAELPGRVWEGKETMLFAVASLCSSCHKAISAEDPGTSNIVVDAVLSACTKKVKLYREAALSSLQEVIKAFGNPEFFKRTFPLLLEICNESMIFKAGNAPIIVASPAAAVEDKSEDVAIPLDKVLDSITTGIHVAHLEDILEQGKSLIHVFLCALSPRFSWTVKISVFSSIRELCSKFHHVVSSCPKFSPDVTFLLHEFADSVAPKVVECLSTIKISQVHISASESLYEMINLFKESPPACRNLSFRDELVHLCEIEKNEQAKLLLQRCLASLEDLMQEIVQ